MIRAGLDVTIDAPGMPRRWAHVERVDAIDALPRISHLESMARTMGYTDSAAAARGILGEAGISRIATVTFRGRCVGTLIFEIHGAWVDTAGQQLSIEVCAVN
jgi:hypothetical protein